MNLTGTDWVAVETKQKKKLILKEDSTCNLKDNVLTFAFNIKKINKTKINDRDWTL